MARVPRPRVVICAERRSDGALSVMEAHRGYCILSDGQELRIPWEKLQGLVDQVCQEQSAIHVRTWWTKDGVELIELHRDGEPSMRISTDTLPAENEAF